MTGTPVFYVRLEASGWKFPRPGMLFPLFQQPNNPKNALALLVRLLLFEMSPPYEQMGSNRILIIIFVCFISVA